MTCSPSRERWLLCAASASGARCRTWRGAASGDRRRRPGRRRRAGLPGAARCAADHQRGRSEGARRVAVTPLLDVNVLIGLTSRNQGYRHHRRRAARTRRGAPRPARHVPYGHGGSSRARNDTGWRRFPCSRCAVHRRGRRRAWLLLRARSRASCSRHAKMSPDGTGRLRVAPGRPRRGESLHGPHHRYPRRRRPGGARLPDGRRHRPLLTGRTPHRQRRVPVGRAIGRRDALPRDARDERP